MEAASYQKLGEPPEALCDGRKCELRLGTSRPTQAQSAEPEDAFEMGGQHLDVLAIAAQSFEGFRLGQPARHSRASS